MWLRMGNRYRALFLLSFSSSKRNRSRIDGNRRRTKTRTERRQRLEKSSLADCFRYVHKASKRLIIAWEEKLRLTIKIKEAERNKGNRRKENVKCEKKGNRKGRRKKLEIRQFRLVSASRENHCVNASRWKLLVKSVLGDYVPLKAKSERNWRERGRESNCEFVKIEFKRNLKIWKNKQSFTDKRGTPG